MKKTLIIFCSVLLVIVLTVTVYNSSKGPSKLSEGITELPLPVQDSLAERGKALINKMTSEDRKAVAAYFGKQ